MMASFDIEECRWHEGEEKMHKCLRVPQHENPTSPFLTPFAAQLLLRTPLVAFGTLDSQGRPWATVWGGERGFTKPIGQSIIGTRATIDRKYDPVAEVLFGDKADGEVIQQEGAGKMVSALGIDLESRKRVKLYGRMVAGSLAATEEGTGDVQLVVKIEQSLGNCPKYLNKKHIIPRIPHPKLVSANPIVPQAALDVITKADLFFISSSNHELDMDMNHRGGPPGFVRVLDNEKTGLVIVYPEYSGNRLYQTLGNLETTPQAGLAFPDFDTGDVLYVTGHTETLVAKAASDLIAYTNLAVKIQVTAARFVSDGLAFRGQKGELSPYNPPVRYLSTEEGQKRVSSAKEVSAKLLSKTLLTPTIGRFIFHIADPLKASAWKPGQYVALDFHEELDIGYSHMRDDDPASLNDAFLRTFTICSRQDEPESHDQVAITVRKHGPVTNHLFRHNMRIPLEVPLVGFGGDFVIQQEGERVAFIAGGVGITPLLAQAKDLDLKRLALYWTIRSEDLPLVIDTFERISGLAMSTKLFVTGRVDITSKDWKTIEALGPQLSQRRIVEEDVKGGEAVRWYLCMTTSFRTTVLGWLEGKKTVFEDFNY